jgi:hypothetical protein
LPYIRRGVFFTREHKTIGMPFIITELTVEKPLAAAELKADTWISLRGSIRRLVCRLLSRN